MNIKKIQQALSNADLALNEHIHITKDINMTFSKHNWNQLSESSQEELKRRQAYQEGYREGLLERGPATHTSNRQGQQFDRFGNPIVTAPPVAPPAPPGPANPFSLAAGDKFGMGLWGGQDDNTPADLRIRRNAMRNRKAPPWTQQ